MWSLQIVLQRLYNGNTLLSLFFFFFGFFFQNFSQLEKTKTDGTGCISRTPQALLSGTLIPRCPQTEEITNVPSWCKDISGLWWLHDNGHLRGKCTTKRFVTYRVTDYATWVDLYNEYPHVITVGKSFLGGSWFLNGVVWYSRGVVY